MLSFFLLFSLKINISGIYSGEGGDKMATEKTEATCRLLLKVKAGVNAKGTAVFRQRSFNNIKATISDSDLYEVAGQLAKLQAAETVSVIRQDEAVLVNK